MKFVTMCLCVDVGAGGKLRRDLGRGEPGVFPKNII